jgi:hypothetical protein
MLQKLKNGGLIMRTVLIGLLMAGLALAAVGTATVGVSAPILTPGYVTNDELSRDNGNMQNAWVYLTGANTYVGDQYDTPTTLIWLYGIKYYVWPGWPDTSYQGFTVGCWKMESGTPSSVVWPTDGNPIYNDNAGGNWIIQDVDGGFDLSTGAPSGFLVGIGFLYTYPAMDAFGVDYTGIGPYDWSYVGGAWGAAPYGKGSARALITDSPPGVETTTMGTIRAMYR